MNQGFMYLSNLVLPSVGIENGNRKLDPFQIYLNDLHLKYGILVRNLQR